MKKTLIAALALLLASCAGETSTEHLSIMGAKIGMPKAEALDSIHGNIAIGEVVDKYDHHSLDYVNYKGAYIPRVDLIWGDDTLRSIKYKFTSFDDEETAENMYAYVKDSTDLGKSLGLTNEYGSSLAGVSVYEDENPFDGERLNILVDPSGMYKDAPILRPTAEQLNLGAVTLGMPEQDARLALIRAYGRPFDSNPMFVWYELVSDVNFTWKDAAYYFGGDKLWLCTYRTYDHSKDEAYKTACAIALSGLSTYRFMEKTDKDGSIYYESRVKYYVDREDFIAEEDGSYHPIATIKVEKGRKGYHVTASYQYTEN